MISSVIAYYATAAANWGMAGALGLVLLAMTILLYAVYIRLTAAEEKIDWQKIGGKDGFIPAGVSDCGVGAIVWSTGLAYDGDKIKDAPKSWADFWDTAKYPGKRGLRKGAKYTLEFALMADGVPATDVYKVLKTKEGVDRAFKKLDALKADIIWWEAGAQPLQLLSSGQVAMTSVYNGRISNINRTAAEGFQRIGAHAAFRRLPGPHGAAASQRPAVGLVVDNSAGHDPALSQICPERDGCSAGL